jgi:hypothetical protein
MTRKKRYAHVVPARMEIFSEVAERLRRISASVEQKNRWRVRSLDQLERLGTRDDPVDADRQSAERLLAQPRSRAPPARDGTGDRRDDGY